MEFTGDCSRPIIDLLKSGKHLITSAIGSFKAFLLALTRIPNFSSCLDKTLTIVPELRRSSSNFSILPTKFTPESPLLDTSLHILLHCRLRIEAPIAAAPTNITNCHTKTLFPNHAKNGFCEFEIAEFTANPIEITADEARQRNSTIERTASKLTPSSDFRTARSDSKALTCQC